MLSIVGDQHRLQGSFFRLLNPFVSSILCSAVNFPICFIQKLRDFLGIVKPEKVIEPRDCVFSFQVVSVEKKN